MLEWFYIFFFQKFGILTTTSYQAIITNCSKFEILPSDLTINLFLRHTVKLWDGMNCHERTEISGSRHVSALGF